MLNLVFDSFPLLQTPRCILRPLEFADEAAVFSLRSSDEVNQYLDRKKATSTEDAKEFIGRIRLLYDSGEVFFWAIEWKETAELVGTITLWNINRAECKAEVGYELLPPFQGRGIMNEVLKEVIRFGFEKMQLVQIEAMLSPLNAKSVKLLEKQGFLLAGKEYEGTETLLVYALKP